MTTIFGYTLRFLRTRQNVSLSALSEATGLGETTLENIENGYILPPDAVAEKLAAYFGVTVSYMTGSVEVTMPTNDAEEAGSPQRYVRLRPIQLTKTVGGAELRSATEAADVILPLPQSDRSSYVAVQVTDNSMLRYRAAAGDILVVREDTGKIRTGDLVLLLSEGGQTLLRRYFREGNDVLLRSDDDDLLPPLRLSECRDTFRLIGAVIRIIVEVDAAFLKRRSQNPPQNPEEILPPFERPLEGAGSCAPLSHDFRY